MIVKQLNMLRNSMDFKRHTTDIGCTSSTTTGAELRACYVLIKFSMSWLNVSYGIP